jgi:hypothetical protein
LLVSATAQSKPFAEAAVEPEFAGTVHPGLVCNDICSIDMDAQNQTK